MKESGIDWIGQIPEEWEVTRIKNFVSIERGASPRPIDKFISDDGTGVNWIRIGDTYKGNKYITSTKLKITNRGKQFSRYIHPGTLILSNSMSFGEPYISSIYGCIHDGWLSLAPFNNISKEYLYWLLLSEVCTSQFNLVSIGAVVENLSVDKVGNTLIPIPYSLSEQQKIADFLDKKTTQLDKVKSLLEEQIQKLKDYRASLIYETVTKGLDKAVPMKDSGIDWIGQVPEGWGVKPLKYLIKFKNGYAFDSKHLTMEQTGVKVIRIGDFKSSGIDFNASLNVFTSFNSKLDFYRIRKSQILIAMSGATVGKISFVNQEPNVYSVINQRVGIIESEINKWIYYCLSTDSFMSYIQLNSNGSAQPNISSGEISDFKVAIPDDVVIQKCVKYLDSQLESINKLIQIKNQQIENINKQRQTLIYDYVTGKRRV